MASVGLRCQPIVRMRDDERLKIARIETRAKLSLLGAHARKLARISFARSLNEAIYLIIKTHHACEICLGMNDMRPNPAITRLFLAS